MRFLGTVLVAASLVMMVEPANFAQDRLVDNGLNLFATAHAGAKPGGKGKNPSLKDTFNKAARKPVLPTTGGSKASGVTGAQGGGASNAARQQSLKVTFKKHASPAPAQKGAVTKTFNANAKGNQLTPTFNAAASKGQLKVQFNRAAAKGGAAKSGSGANPPPTAAHNLPGPTLKPTFKQSKSAAKKQQSKDNAAQITLPKPPSP